MAKKKPKTKGKQVVKPAVIETISNEVIAAAYSAASQPLMPVFLKVCRLCESKDGPFLNIFEADKLTAKKIEELMPFNVTENDDLPHKICFRCSAKLEELYEFIQKCIKTQENLRSALGKSGPFILKNKTGKKQWEEKLIKSNMSNDDICDALIKKAMEGIKNIPAKPLPVEEETPLENKRVTRSKEITAAKSDNNDDVSLKQVKMSIDKNDIKPVTSKVTRSNKADPSPPKKAETLNLDPAPPNKRKELSKKDSAQNKLESQDDSNSQNEKSTEQKTRTSNLNNFSFDYEEPASSATKVNDSEEEKNEEPKKPFNIMDHISMIKVNGVGILYQCKLCNRNFLKKEIVESHNCAKNGIPKVDFHKSIPAPEPPKVPTVKYIKIDSDMKKTLTEKTKKAERNEIEKSSIETNVAANEPPPPKIKPKPKAGPASKTRRNVIDSDSCASQNSSEPTPTINPESSGALSAVAPGQPSVHFPTMPNLNGRFKLVPGPNNIFTLVEDVSGSQSGSGQDQKKPSKKRKSDEITSDSRTQEKDSKSGRDKSKSPEVIDLEEQSKPYPVGLFQTVAHNSGLYGAPVPEAPCTFTTPAMKKQSYTIVQTGNPSKLLISTKAKAVEMEAPKKRPRKNKVTETEDPEPRPFKFSIEDNNTSKDAGFFTFINVDPLLQPSYVLPTDNIIQESQISTSSAVKQPPPESKDKYSCNMCGEIFSREKKLLSHIQSHYTKMDEEDQLREERSVKKKARK